MSVVRRWRIQRALRRLERLAVQPVDASWYLRKQQVDYALERLIAV